jgi:taurine dioxygenase
VPANSRISKEATAKLQKHAEVMKAVDIVVRPLSTILGAEVTGVDARDELSDSIRQQLREAWYKHSLLLIRNQVLNEAEQLRFATTFGEISKQHHATEGFNYVSNVAEGGTNPYGGLGFHFDHSFLPAPLRGIMLYAIEVPPEGSGGETLFANVKLAYQSIPEPLSSRIRTLAIRHGVPDTSKHEAMPGLARGPDPIRADHPLVFTHPATGEPFLFLSRRHADCILDLTHSESEELMDELSEYLYQPNHIYSHMWRPGDVVVWDNLALQHGRSDFDPKWRRHLRRVQIGQ